MTLIQQALKASKILKRFSFEDLTICLPSGNSKATIRKYITALIKNGNIERVSPNVYKYKTDKKVSSRTASKAQIIKAMRSVDGFYTSAIIKKANANSKDVAAVINDYANQGLLSCKYIRDRAYYTWTGGKK